MLVCNSRALWCPALASGTTGRLAAFSSRKPFVVPNVKRPCLVVFVDFAGQHCCGLLFFACFVQLFQFILSLLRHLVVFTYFKRPTNIFSSMKLGETL